MPKDLSLGGFDMHKIVLSILSKNIQLSKEKLSHLLETPPSRDKGDLAFPCFQLAKQYRQSPNQIALDLAEQMLTQVEQEATLNKVEAIGPYLNFYYNRQQLAGQMMNMSIEQQLAEHQIGQNKTVVVEYSSPNIAKHFKLYHIRSTMIGQALANTYAALGYHVERINHLGDWGTQFGKLMAAYEHWGNDQRIEDDPINELVHLYVRFHEEAQSNPVLEDEGKQWFKKLEQGDPQAEHLWERFKTESLKEFSKIYELLGVKFDHYLGESYYGPKMNDVLEELKQKKLLQNSEGAEVVFLDEHLPPCIIKKSDGTSIYATRDIAAAIYRHEHFHPIKMLYVVDQRQALHFEQVFSVIDKMGYVFPEGIVHIDFGIMKMDGEIGSTRQGKGLLLHEVLHAVIDRAREVVHEKNPDIADKEEIAQAVGTGALIFNDLKQHRTHEVNFQWEEALNFEGKTGPYVQYTHARICSLLKRVNDSEIQTNPHPFFEKELSWQLIYKLNEYANVLKETTRKDDPSQIAAYLLDLCQLFNRLYAQERIFTDDHAEQTAKLSLCNKIAQVLKHGLHMLTIKAPTKI